MTGPFTQGHCWLSHSQGPRPPQAESQKPSPSSPSQPPVRPPAAIQPLLRGHLGVLGPRTVAVLAVLEGGIGVLLEPIEPKADADTRRRVKVAPRLPFLPQGEIIKLESLKGT